MTHRFVESTVEEAALDWLEGLGYALRNGPDIAPGEPEAERDTYGQVILEHRLRQALVRLNPTLPSHCVEDALHKLTQPEAATLEARNRAFHRPLVDGVTVEYCRRDGSSADAQVRVVDFEKADNNDWLAVSQSTVIEDRHNRRPDGVLFVNGLLCWVLCQSQGNRGRFAFTG